ncbi:UNKNOWN [Stylonychia lemnae]|uniref:Macro domain-containing protein n=1 Tax=Stylonychia lemnae TaxID=5949 RepID=A0A077ZS05_STYLE|nr:UNKNOWN [Stylonychia lemnae]|eukprot:CDW72667.1 UNKNOWN [Stylonychia lemnae]
MFIAFWNFFNGQDNSNENQSTSSQSSDSSDRKRENQRLNSSSNNQIQEKDGQLSFHAFDNKLNGSKAEQNLYDNNKLHNGNYQERKISSYRFNSTTTDKPQNEPQINNDIQMQQENLQDKFEKQEDIHQNYEQMPLDFQIIGQYKVILGGWLEVSVNMGDITEEKVDAITNAANEKLLHGGGVAAAIIKKGGHQIQIESDSWKERYGLVQVGTAPVVTGSGNIKNCKQIIHAVGPRWTNDTCRTACKYNLKSVSIPAISSGIFRFPRKLCAAHLFRAVEDFCFENRLEIQVDSNPSLRVIRFTNFDLPTKFNDKERKYEAKIHQREIHDQETQTLLSYDEVEMRIGNQIRDKIKKELVAEYALRYKELVKKWENERRELLDRDQNSQQYQHHAQQHNSHNRFDPILNKNGNLNILKVTLIMYKEGDITETGK